MSSRSTSKGGKGKAVLNAFASQAVFSELSYSYPLKLLSPKLPSNGSHPAAIVYILSYGGGLVPGDRIELEVVVGPDSALVILTQGSTKVFKARSEYIHRLANSTSPSSVVQQTSSIPMTQPTSAVPTTPTIQNMTVKISDGGLLLLLVDPVTCFRDATYSQHQTFYLTPTSSLILLDWITAGRISRGEEWAFTRYHSVNEVWVENRRCVREVMFLERPSFQNCPNVPISSCYGSLKKRLEPYRCYATVIMFGPLVVTVAQELTGRQLEIQQMQRTTPPDFLWSLSEIQVEGAQNGWIIRAAAKETETIKMWLKDALRGIEDAVGKEIYSKAFI